MLETVALVSGVVMMAGGTAALILIWRWARQPIEAPPAWAPAELASLPPAMLREPCVHCGGKHCAGCTEPARVTSTATGHVPRHDWLEIPPSLAWLAERVDVVFRATLITAELVGHHVTRPADGVAFRLWAKRKLGRPLQLGTFQRKALLP